MKLCLYCKGKLETIYEGYSAGQLRCTVCRAIFIEGKNKPEDYACDENGNPE